MTCGELYDRLTDLTEGTLTGEVCDEVERHLSECPDCQHVREDLEDLARLCRQVSAVPSMPDDVRRRIEMLLASPDDPPRRPTA